MGCTLGKTLKCLNTLLPLRAVCDPVLQVANRVLIHVRCRFLTSVSG